MSDAARSKVEDILSKAGVAFLVTYRGEELGALMGGSSMDKWCCTLTNKNNKVEHFDFFTGLGLRNPPTERSLALVNKPKPPHPADVLYSILLDLEACGQSFKCWCDDLGYDTDSIKAFKIYSQCQENGDKLRKIFSDAVIDALREALDNY